MRKVASAILVTSSFWALLSPRIADLLLAASVAVFLENSIKSTTKTHCRVSSRRPIRLNKSLTRLHSERWFDFDTLWTRWLWQCSMTRNIQLISIVLLRFECGLSICVCAVAQHREEWPRVYIYSDGAQFLWNFFPASTQFVCGIN